MDGLCMYMQNFAVIIAVIGTPAQVYWFDTYEQAQAFIGYREPNHLEHYTIVSQEEFNDL